MLVRMSECVSLQMNLGKAKAMVYNPIFIWGQKSEVLYKWRVTGEGVTFRERNSTRLSCEVCGSTMAVSSLQNHLYRAYGKIMTQTRGVDVKGGGAETYVVSSQRIVKLVELPVEGCLER